MTLEEIKSEIESFIFYAEVEARAAKKNEWGHGFQVGKINAYENCLRWLDQFEPSWHEYPKEKPVSGLYRVTLDVPPFAITRDLYYNSVTGLWEHPRGGGEIALDVIAWAELPKPYKKEATNDT